MEPTHIMTHQEAERELWNQGLGLDLQWQWCLQSSTLIWEAGPVNTVGDISHSSCISINSPVLGLFSCNPHLEDTFSFL